MLLQLQSIAFIISFIQLSYSSPFNPRIVNGTNANIADFPWIVSLQKGKNHNCGGSIIDKNWILTAAHCSNVDNVRYGTHNISSNGGGEVIKVKEFISHKNFSWTILNDDIAVVRLEKPLKLSKIAKAVQLPKAFSEVSGNWETKVDLVGFGYEKSWGLVQERLQKAELLVASNAHCSKVHKRTVFQSNICAGIPEGGKGQCSGDSGGPLTLKNGVQVGIVSWSEKPCAIAPYPGVYTKVSHYIQWIKNQTGLKLN